VAFALSATTSFRCLRATPPQVCLTFSPPVNPEARERIINDLSNKTAAHDLDDNGDYDFN
jgi:hypothetical protein